MKKSIEERVAKWKKKREFYLSRSIGLSSFVFGIFYFIDLYFHDGKEFYMTIGFGLAWMILMISIMVFLSNENTYKTYLKN